MPFMVIQNNTVSKNLSPHPKNYNTMDIYHEIGIVTFKILFNYRLCNSIDRHRAVPVIYNYYMQRGCCYGI